MKTAIFSNHSGEWRGHPGNNPLDHAKVSLVITLGDKAALASPALYGKLRQDYPHAEIALCSTAGEIYDDSVQDGSVSVTAVEFEKTLVRSAMVNIADFEGSSHDAGNALVARLLAHEGLSYVLILSDGSQVNGSELVKGINSRVGEKIPVTGGLAGDGAAFKSTLVGLNGQPGYGQIVAIGLYGPHLEVSHGSKGGWESFGPERRITRSKGNQLFMIDDESALDLYKKYLGPYANELPGSALLFPLMVRLSDAEEPVVRTILSIDEETRSMYFAGDVPQDASVRFMKANFDRLIDAASTAANQTCAAQSANGPSLSLLISCVGRKMILGNRVTEEVEAVKEAVGDKTLITGFYSYGEIAPPFPREQCQLHNQTMTITTISER
jgi:hypothetical protein